MREIDIGAPIIPGVGLGGVELRTHIFDYDDLLFHARSGSQELEATIVGQYEARYTFRQAGISISVDVRNGKVFKITAYQGYQGTLFGEIRVGMRVQEALDRFPCLYYDEAFALVLCRTEKGVAVDVSEEDAPAERVPFLTIDAINVIAPEAFTPNGQHGKW
jgi:hypothetical protein